jgi:hypothetical protein
MTARLAYETRRLRDLVDEKGELWTDQGGKTTLHHYLRPQAEAAQDLVTALQEQDELLAAFEEEMAIVERELEVAASAHLQTEAALSRAREDVQAADEMLPEVLEGLAAAEKLETRAVRFADLANGYPGDREVETARAQRRAELTRLQQSYPTLNVGHILEGEFNGRGDFTGCHSRRSVTGMLLEWEKEDSKGIYHASVSGWSPDEKVVDKTVPVHSMFPDSWTDDQICREVLSAFEAKNFKAKDSKKPLKKFWKGRSTSGVQIMGHVERGLILAYPRRKDVDP